MTPSVVRRLVLADENGRIVASALHPDEHEQTDPAAPRFWGYLPLPGQTVHEVELTGELLDPDGLSRLHRDFVVTADSGHTALRRRSG